MKSSPWRVPYAASLPQRSWRQSMGRSGSVSARGVNSSTPRRGSRSPRRSTPASTRSTSPRPSRSSRATSRIIAIQIPRRARARGEIPSRPGSIPRRGMQHGHASQTRARTRLGGGWSRAIESLARIASEHLGLPVHNCLLQELPESEEGTFDVVALSDVFEHITEPRPFLRDVRRFLKPEGPLPEGSKRALERLKQRVLERMGRSVTQGVWDSYEHVVHYTDETLRRISTPRATRPSSSWSPARCRCPVWHEYVGQYYQYPSPWQLDPKRYLGRSGFYHLSRIGTACARWADRLLRAKPHLRGARSQGCG